MGSSWFHMKHKPHFSPSPAKHTQPESNHGDLFTQTDPEGLPSAFRVSGSLKARRAAELRAMVLVTIPSVGGEGAGARRPEGAACPVGEEAALEVSCQQPD